MARRLSYAVTGNPNFNRLDGVRCSRRSQIIPPSPSPKFVLNDFTENRSELRRPSNVSNNRRRISVVALNNFVCIDILIISIDLIKSYLV